MPPNFQEGDMVQFGLAGTVPYEVVAVTTSGRIPTYDLVSQGKISKGRRFQAVVEINLVRYRGLNG